MMNFMNNGGQPSLGSGSGFMNNRQQQNTLGGIQQNNRGYQPQQQQWPMYQNETSPMPYRNEASPMWGQQQQQQQQPLYQQPMYQPNDVYSRIEEAKRRRFMRRFQRQPMAPPQFGSRWGY
jgi:hypothetical protein